MCASSSSSILLYEDVAKLPHEVRWLDCSASSPKSVQGRGITHTQQNFIQDMCCVDIGDKELLITTKGFGGGVYAYNTKTDKMEWSVEGKLPGIEKNVRPVGVTSDGHGHLFVSDNENKCIHMFATDGGYMGALLREEVQTLSQLAGIRWSNKFSSLLVVHMVNERYSISAIRNALESSETMFEDEVEVMPPIEAAAQVEETAQEESTEVQASSRKDTAPISKDISKQQTEAPMEEDVIIIEDTFTPTEETEITYPVQPEDVSQAKYKGNLPISFHSIRLVGAGVHKVFGSFGNEPMQSCSVRRVVVLSVSSALALASVSSVYSSPSDSFDHRNFISCKYM